MLQLKLFCLAASPRGLVSDKSNEDISKTGLIEAKCLKSKKNSKINDQVNDQSFYDKHKVRVPELKKTSSKRLLYINTNGNVTLSNKIL